MVKPNTKSQNLAYTFLGLKTKAKGKTHFWGTGCFYYHHVHVKRLIKTINKPEIWR